MNADKIIERLERLRGEWLSEANGTAYMATGLTPDRRLSIELRRLNRDRADLDAAIDDIRGMLQEPVKCQRCSGLGRILSMTGPYAEEVCRVCDGTGRYPDAQGGTDAK